MAYVCLGLGSNIEPRENLVEGIERLLARVGSLWVSDILATHPVEMDTSRAFLNTVVWFESALEPSALKAWLNDLEEAMGRDRSDPDRSTSDRAIDFDVLWVGDEPAPPATVADAQTPYFAAPFARLRAWLHGDRVSVDPSLPRVELVVGGRRVGMEPTAVHADGGAGHEAR